jgi:lipid-binding SYLF domain-containing protein
MGEVRDEVHTMKLWLSAIACASLCLGLWTGVSARQGADIKDEVEQSEKAARIIDEIMAAPDKEIPAEIFEDARCVGVFPSVLKVAFGIGGSGGRGLVSCRHATGWSPPAYFTLGSGSIGFQIGAESTDLVMLFMTDNSINSLMATKFEVGADLSVAAGPVGRQAGASTDAKLDAQILSYSRSKGLFAGVALKGAVIQPHESDMRDAYGAGITARDVLKESTTVTTAAALRAFPAALARHSARQVS